MVQSQLSTPLQFKPAVNSSSCFPDQKYYCHFAITACCGLCNKNARVPLPGMQLISSLPTESGKQQFRLSGCFSFKHGQRYDPGITPWGNPLFVTQQPAGGLTDRAYFGVWKKTSTFVLFIHDLLLSVGYCECFAVVLQFNHGLCFMLEY